MADFEKMFVVKNEVEAGVLDTVLDERGIPHLNCSYDDSVCDGLFQLQKGWGVLYAAEEHRREIKEIHTALDPSLEERKPEQP